MVGKEGNRAYIWAAGTGKSTMIRPTDNFLEYEVYRNHLTSGKNNTDCRSSSTDKMLRSNLLDLNSGKRSRGRTEENSNLGEKKKVDIKGGSFCLQISHLLSRVLGIYNTYQHLDLGPFRPTYTHTGPPLPDGSPACFQRVVAYHRLQCWRNTKVHHCFVGDIDAFEVEHTTKHKGKKAANGNEINVDDNHTLAYRVFRQEQ